MATGELRSEPSVILYAAQKVAAVSGTFTTTGKVTLVAAPGAGKYIVLKFLRLIAHVTTVLASATVGDDVHVDVNEDATRFATLGIIAAANDAVGTKYDLLASNPLVIPGGYKLAANKALKVGSGASITTGVIRVTGHVGYDIVDR